jgi:hypothetical protein
MTMSPAIEARASWMINRYRNITIGGSTPNNAEAQKFGWADVLARLHLNPNDPVPISRFVSLILQANAFNTAFMPAGAAWIMCKYWDRFTPAQRDSLLAKFKQQGAAITSHGTENHFLIYRAGAYIWAELWPNETGWVGGRTSAQVRQLAKNELLTFLRNHYSRGYQEHLSTNYLSVHLYPLHALYNCVKDVELKAAVEAVLTLHAVEMAANFFKGSTVAPFSRDSSHPRGESQTNNTISTHMKAVYWLWWAELMNTPQTSPVFQSAGATGWNGEASHFGVTSALSSWRPPAVCLELAQLPLSLRGAAKEFGERGAGDAAFVHRTVWKTPDFAAGSANYTYRIDPPPHGRIAGTSDANGYGVLLASTKNRNEIVVHHPYWRSSSEEYQWLHKSSPFQQNAQHEGTIISLFNIPATDPLAGRGDTKWRTYRNEGMIQESWIRIPKTMDELLITPNKQLIFAREGNTFVAIFSRFPFVENYEEFSDMLSLKVSGAKNVVVVEVASRPQFENLSQFRFAVLTKPRTINLSTMTARWGNLTAKWGEFDSSRPVFSSVPELTVDGIPQTMRDPDFASAKAVMKSNLLTLENRVLRATVPSGELTVDWSGSTPVFQQ